MARLLSKLNEGLLPAWTLLSGNAPIHKDLVAYGLSPALALPIKKGCDHLACVAVRGVLVQVACYAIKVSFHILKGFTQTVRQ